jgi:hypothetical protein
MNADFSMAEFQRFRTLKHEENAEWRAKREAGKI